MKLARKVAKLRLALLVGTWLALSSGASATNLRFTNATLQAGISYQYTRPSTNGFDANDIDFVDMVGGAVAEDFDGDGWTDLYTLNGHGSTNQLYMNQHNGTFLDEAAGRGVALATDTVGAAAADFDNDGDIDMCVTMLWSPPKLLVNDGTGTFHVVELDITNVINYFGPPDSYSSPSFGDLNNDGYLDLAVGCRSSFGLLMIFTNNGSNFTALTDFLFDKRVFSPAFFDYNNDHYADLAAVSDFKNTKLYRNNAGTLVNVTTNSGAIATDENGMGCAFGDYDNDGDLDWFVTSIRDTNSPTAPQTGPTGNRMYRNNGDGTFSDATDVAGVRDGNWGWGCVFADLDNDGDLDLFHVNGMTYSKVTAGTNTYDFPSRFNNQPARLFENRGDGTFTNVASAAGADDTGQGRGLVAFDYDNDGDMDLFIVNNQIFTVAGTNEFHAPASPSLLRNDTPATNRWLNVLLAGTPPFHRNGIGSRAVITAGGLRQMRELNASTSYQSQGPNRIAHFGLGTNTIAAEVRAEWVDGSATLVENVTNNQTITLPSPAAVVTNSSAFPGQLFTVSATNIAPTGTPRFWIVNGVTNGDPANIQLYAGGTNELRLRMYDGTGTNLLRTELHRVTVRLLDMAVIDRGFLPNEWNLLWNTDAGRSYKVQATTSGLAGPWFDVSGTNTSFFSPDFIVVSNATPSAAFRLLELAP